MTHFVQWFRLWLRLRYLTHQYRSQWTYGGGDRCKDSTSYQWESYPAYLPGVWWNGLFWLGPGKTWSQDILCSAPITVWSMMGLSITLESWVAIMQTSTLALRWAATTVTIIWSLTHRLGCMWGFTPEASGVINVIGHSLVLQHCGYMTSYIALRGTPWTATNVTRCMLWPQPWEFMCKASIDQALSVETILNILIHWLSWRGMQPSVTRNIITSWNSTLRCLVFVISCK